MKFFLSCLIFVNSFSSLAYQESEQGLLQLRTISVAPYGSNDGSTAQGVYYELSNMLAKESGYQINHHIYPYARIIHELKSGKTDLSILFKYKELEEYVDYISPLPALKNVVIGRKGSTFNSIKQLKGKRLAYLRGASFNDEIDEDDEIYKQSVTNFIQGIKMLAIGRVDAIIGPLDPIIAATLALKMKVDFLGEPLTVSTRTPWLQMSKKSLHGSAKEKLKAHFQAILKRGELDRLRLKYIPAY